MPANNNSIAAIPVLERIEQKRASVKYRLNELVDDLFAYLTSELTQQLSVPPDRLLLSLQHQQRPHPQQQHQQQQAPERLPAHQDNLSVPSPAAAAVDLSLSSTSDHHYPHQYHQYCQQSSHEEGTNTNGYTDASANANTDRSSQQTEVKEEQAEETESPSIQLVTSNALPVIVVNNNITKNNSNNISSNSSSSSSSSSTTTPTSKYAPERPPLTRASSEPPHPRKAALQQETNSLFLPSTSTGGSSAGSSTVTVHTVPDDLEDLDDMDEHSDSDCDCEQCMGVPICKVDLDEAEISELKAAAAGHSSERPTKRARTSALATAAGSGSGVNSANYSPSSPTSPLSTEAIADLQEDFHLQETVVEQCSATFKTISIKCSRDDCRSMFKNKVERNQHLLTVHGTQPYTCLMRDCNQGFDNVRQYGEHVNSEHKEVNHWPCTKCPKVCTDHRLLCRHIYFYHQEGRFKCRKSKCCFVAPYRIDVRKHSQLHTEMYACQFGCGKSFSHTHHRKRHERIHLRLKPFRCKLCQYCSEARSTVIRHIRIRHFNLPLTLKQQNELNIVDNRDPRDYMEILSELMN